MPPRPLLRSFLALWIITGALLCYGSVATVRSALNAPGHSAPHLAPLGSVEALAALLFLLPRAMRIAAIGLLLTIGIALTVHAALGQFRGDLVLYATAVVFIMVHGPLTQEQFARALGRAA